MNRGFLKGLCGLLLALFLGQTEVLGRSLMCSSPRKTMFFATNSIFFKGNCTLWTTSLNATVGNDSTPAFLETAGTDVKGFSNKYAYPASVNFGTPFHWNNATGKVDYLVTSVSEGPTYNFVRGVHLVIFNDSWVTPGIPGAMLLATRIDKSQFITMTQAGDWEKPTGGVQMSRIWAYDFNLTASPRRAGGGPRLYHIAMQQTAALTGITPSATIYFQETYDYTHMHAWKLRREAQITCGTTFCCPYSQLPIDYTALTWSSVNWVPFDPQPEFNQGLRAIHGSVPSPNPRGWVGPNYNVYITSIRAPSVVPYISPAPRGMSIGFCEGSVEMWKTCCNSWFPASPSTSRSPTPSRSVSVTPTNDIAGASESASETVSPSVTPSQSEEASVSESPSTSGSVTPTITTTPSPASESVTPSVSPSSSVTASVFVSPSVSASVTETEVFSESATNSVSKSETPSSTETSSVAASVSVSSSVTASGSASPSESVSGSVAPSASPSNAETPSTTGSRTPSPSVSRSGTPSPSTSRSTSPSPTNSRSTSPSPSRSRTGTASRSTLPSITPSPSVSPSRTVSSSVTPSSSPQPHVMVDVAVAGPDVVTTPSSADILYVMIGLKCDLASIIGCPIEDIDVATLSGIAFDYWGITFTDEEYQQLRDANMGICKAMLAEMGVSSDDDDDWFQEGRRRLSEREMELQDQQQPLSDYGRRILARNRVSRANVPPRVVYGTESFFNVSLRITPSEGSAIVQRTSKNKNVLVEVQARVSKALSLAGTAAGQRLFQRAYTGWSDLLNVTDWNSNSMFVPGEVKPVAFIPGAVATPAPESPKYMLPIILGSTLSAVLGACLIVLAILMLRRKRRKVGEQRTQEAGYLAAALQKQRQPPQPNGVIAVSSVSAPESSREVYPSSPLPITSA